MQRRLYILLAIVIVAVSCQRGEGQFEPQLVGGDVMQFTTSVVESRAGASTDNLTEFGISVSNSSNANFSYSNIYVSKSGSEWVTSQTMLWQSANQEVTISAHAPYDSGFSDNFVVEADQSSDSNFTASDHLYAHSTVTPSVTDSTKDVYCDDNGVVNVSLTHILAKLTIDLTFTSDFYGITENPITTILIGDLYLDGSVDGNTYDISVGSTSGSVTPFNNGDFSAEDRTVSYQAILIPQTVLGQDSFSVKIEANGKSYTWRPDSDITLLSGRNHTLALNVGKDESLLFMDGEVTVKEWSSTKISVDNGDGSIGSIEVGDLYPNEVNPVGVVYCVNADGLSGKVVSLDQTVGAWSNTTTPTYANSETDGLANMRTILSVDSNFANHPSCAWVDSKNSDASSYADDSKGVWYLPSKDELAELHTVYNASDTVMDAIEDADGTPIAGGYYWSSTENVTYNTSIWVEIFLGNMEYESIDKSDDANYTRAILSF